MRFIIKEQPYEQVIAAGQYRYERDGRATGAVEHWRLTAVTDGYQFLRVDLDARAAPSGHTYLYHAVVNPDGQVERLKYRLWEQAAGGLQVVGDVVLAETAVTATHTFNGEDSEQVVDLPKGYRFWFPSVAGLHFAGWRGNEPKTAVTLHGQIGGPDTLAVQLVDFEYFMLITDFMEMTAAGKVRSYSPCKLSWGEGHWRIIQRSAENGWPLGMMRDDGLTAVAVQEIWYQNR